MVAVIAAFTVWTCLAMLASAADYERRRRTLGLEVRELRKRYSFHRAATDAEATTGTDREAA